MEETLIKCPYCDRTFKTYNGLTKHVIRFKAHGEITQEQLLSDFKYNGKRPLCKCGCGQETEIVWENGAHFGDYIKGHYSRVHNNWGHNKNAIKNSIKTRQKRFKSGEITQWNKGKLWEETYTEEQINNLLENYKDEERNKKISKSLKIKNKDPYMKEMHSRTLRERLKNQTFSLTSKAEDNFAKKYLEEMDIKYIPQKYIKEIKQFCDFYIEEKDIYIEFDGDFWHCNPKKYPDGPIHKFQEIKIYKDQIKNKWMKDNNKKIIRIWEDDVKNNEEYVLKLLEPLID